eukprot:7778839-Karenia_brevis.AAC.1
MTNSEIRVRGDPHDGDRGGLLTANTIRPSGFAIQPTLLPFEKSGAQTDPLAKMLQGLKPNTWFDISKDDQPLLAQFGKSMPSSQLGVRLPREKANGR